MRYTVSWHSKALDELARIWLQASNRRAITAAVNQIDRLRRHAAEQVGVQHQGDWYLAVRPLAVIYSVSPDDRLVQVLGVRLVP